MNRTQSIKDIVKKRDITTWFQPIVDLEENGLLGWEALTRGPSISPLHSAPALFEAATEAGVLKALEMECCRSATNCFDQLQLRNKLFVNLSHEALIAGSKLKEHLIEIIIAGDVPPNRIVLELTERSATENKSELIEAMNYFHEQGFEIAIDDLGAGYSSVEQWHLARPDYVKIDRHYINSIDLDKSKQDFVRSIVAIARSVHSKVIAKGVETSNELKVLRGLGIHLFQGYLFQRPELSPLPPNLERYVIGRTHLSSDTNALACDLVVSQRHIRPDVLSKDVVSMFNENVGLSSVAVVKEDETPIGLVDRHAFLAAMSKRYRREVELKKPISKTMDADFLIVDSHLHLEQLSRLVTSRARIHASQDFIITNQDKFLGIGNVIDLLRQITELQIHSSRYANTLTMLPGTVPVGDCVNALLRERTDFTIALFSLNNLRPFNSTYSYSKGDQVITLFSELIRKHFANKTDLIGHVGADNFVLIFNEESWRESLESFSKEFTHRIPGFYSREDQHEGCMIATDHDGNTQRYGFIELAIGIFDVGDEVFKDYQELAAELRQLNMRIRKAKNVIVGHRTADKVSFSQIEGESLVAVAEESEE